jgi:ribosome recycling factor
MEDEILLEVEEKMENAINALENRFKTVRTGRANPSSLDKVMVNYYGAMTPLRQLANITVPEARQLLIKPFDKSSLGAIEKAILASNLGYNPGNDGETIRIVIPELTEERRKELAKQVKAIAEDSKVSIRNIRHDGIENIKKCELPEDEEKDLEGDIQDLDNGYNRNIDAKLKEKEQELLTV